MPIGIGWHSSLNANRRQLWLHLMMMMTTWQHLRSWYIIFFPSENKKAKNNISLLLIDLVLFGMGLEKQITKEMFDYRLYFILLVLNQTLKTSKYNSFFTELFDTQITMRKTLPCRNLPVFLTKAWRILHPKYTCTFSQPKVK